MNLTKQEARVCVLCAYAGGFMTRARAMGLLEFGWYGQLVDALAAAGISLAVDEGRHKEMCEAVDELLGPHITDEMRLIYGPLPELSTQYMHERLDAADMLSVEVVAKLLDIDGEAVEDLIRSHRVLAIRSPGRVWCLPVWQFVEPLQSLMPAVLAALSLEGWRVLAWLETPLGGLQGLTPRAAIERGLGARVVELAQAEGS